MNLEKSRLMEMEEMYYDYLISMKKLGFTSEEIAKYLLMKSIWLPQYRVIKEDETHIERG